MRKIHSKALFLFLKIEQLPVFRRIFTRIVFYLALVAADGWMDDGRMVVVVVSRNVRLLRSVVVTHR